MLKRLEQETLEITIAEKPFDPRAEGQPCFILMPVPNITGNLHIGHGINLILQDLLSRYKRMEGHNVFFPPGADHAGIMGQYTAEKRLNEMGTSRAKLGRVEFNKFMRSESERHLKSLIGEMRKLGLKAEWSHIWFTHDEKRDAYVEEVFLKLYERGLVYREESVVNWCPHCGSCVSDMELNLAETMEKVYRVSLDVASAGRVSLIFVQPELLLGAVAVGITNQHPRFAELIGKIVRLPLTGKPVKVIEVAPRLNSLFDAELRLVVPTYNFDDFKLAQANDLPIRNIYDNDGCVELKGAHHTIEDVRCLIVTELEKHDGYGFTEFGQGRAYHALCGTLVLPMVKSQWYMRMHKMEPKARELLESGRLRFSGESWRKGHTDVLDNIRTSILPEKQKWWEGACVGVAQGYSSNKDWVISRQNWWGQPLPILHCKDCGHAMPMRSDSDQRCDICNSTKLVPDQDVLDVWFSCAIWPISVNPFSLKGVFSDVAVMGQDIFYFWVASANMICMELYGQPAFKNMLVHGLLCDSNGKKMSKSLGNVISMQDILDKYGAETLRAFVYGVMKGNADSQWLLVGKDDIKVAHRTAEEVLSLLLSKADGALVKGSANEQADTSGQIEALRNQVSTYMAELHSGEAYEAVLAFLRSGDYTGAHFSRDQFFELLKIIHPFHPFITNHLYTTALGGKSCLSDLRRGSIPLESLVQDLGRMPEASMPWSASDLKDHELGCQAIHP